MDNTYKGKIAVITGGGRGFGKAFGTALAERGAHVALADIDLDAAREAAAGLTERGLSAAAHAADVADDSQVAALMTEIAAAQGGIDILINNAGLHSAAYNLPTREMGAAKIRRLFEVNVMAVITCTLAATRFMAGRAGASIVNISSAAAYGCATAYGVSKLAVRGLTLMQARELAADGIRVNAIAPGLIGTETIRAELDPRVVATVQGQQFIKRWGEEADITAAMLYLTSPQAGFVSGETLLVGGGFAAGV